MPLATIFHNVFHYNYLIDIYALLYCLRLLLIDKMFSVLTATSSTNGYIVSIDIDGRGNNVWKDQLIFDRKALNPCQLRLEWKHPVESC